MKTFFEQLTRLGLKNDDWKFYVLFEQLTRLGLKNDVAMMTL